MKHQWDEYDEYRAQQAEADVERFLKRLRSAWAAVKSFFKRTVRP